jgi:hypothetical protein
MASQVVSVGRWPRRTGEGLVPDGVSMKPAFQFKMNQNDDT